MRLYCFDEECVNSIDGERTKYFYNPEKERLIGFYFNDHGILFEEGKIKSEFISEMKNLIAEKENKSGKLKYLGEINAPDNEMKEILCFGDYYERLFRKKEKTKEMTDRENKSQEIVNQKIKSLVDLIK
jgi:hypothetical protein